MAALGKGKAVSKNDLKRLMKERKDAISQSSKRITSAFAKYNSLGHLICTVCNTHIKSETLWSAHILGKAHKQNVELLKGKSDPVTAKHEFVNRKRSKEGESADNAEKAGATAQQSQNERETGVPPSKRSRQPSLLSFDTSDDESEGNNETEGSKSTPAEGEGLPSDFFDNAASKPKEASAKPKSSKRGPPTALPEGFFDDPIKDAKARNVEYKDPIEEEWEKFQKAIAEETTVSEAIMEEDAEESKVERDIEEIDEQIHNWSRVEQLQQRKEDLMKNELNNGAEGGDSDSDIGDQDFDEYLNWRAKGAWK